MQKNKTFPSLILVPFLTSLITLLSITPSSALCYQTVTTPVSVPTTISQLVAVSTPVTNMVYSTVRTPVTTQTPVVTQRAVSTYVTVDVPHTSYTLTPVTSTVYSSYNQYGYTRHINYWSNHGPTSCSGYQVYACGSGHSAWRWTGDTTYDIDHWVPYSYQQTTYVRTPYTYYTQSTQRVTTYVDVTTWVTSTTYVNQVVATPVTTYVTTYETRNVTTYTTQYVTSTVPVSCTPTPTPTFTPPTPTPTPTFTPPTPTPTPTSSSINRPT